MGDVDVIIDVEGGSDGGFLRAFEGFVLTEEELTFDSDDTLIVVYLEVGAGKNIILSDCSELGLEEVGHVSVEDEIQLEEVSCLWNASNLEFNHEVTHIVDVSIGVSFKSDEIVGDILEEEGVGSS